MISCLTVLDFNMFLIGASGNIGQSILQSGIDKKIKKFGFSDWANVNLFTERLNDSFQSNLSTRIGFIWVAGASNPRSSEQILKKDRDIFIAFIKSIQCALEAGAHIKIIFLSSSGSIFNFTSRKFYNEYDSPGPTSRYGFLKIYQERLLLELKKYSNLDLVILRSPSVFGMPKTSNKGLIDCLLRSKNGLEITSHLDTKRQYLFIGDLVDTIGKTLEIDLLKEENSVKHIAPNAIVSIRDIFDVLEISRKNNVIISDDGKEESLVIESKNLSILNLPTYVDPLTYLKISNI